LDSEVLIVGGVEHRLLAEGVSICFWGCGMPGKAAVITVELIDESLCSSNRMIAADLFRWFNEEALPAPWVKKVKVVSVKEFQKPNSATWLVNK
jgi:hypothetical protein